MRAVTWVAGGLSGLSSGLALMGLWAYFRARQRAVISSVVAGLLFSWGITNLVIFVLVFWKINAKYLAYVWIAAQIVAIAVEAFNLYLWDYRGHRRKESAYAFRNVKKGRLL